VSWEEQITIAGVFGVVAIMLLVLGLLGERRRLPRNPLFGVRTKTSTASDEAWREVHARFAPYAYAAAGVLAVTAVAPLITGGGAGLVLGGTALGVGVMAFGAVRAHREL